MKSFAYSIGVFLSLTLACSSSSDSQPGAGGGGGFGAFGGGGGAGNAPPSDCQSRCTSLATDCGQDSSQCGELCGQIGEEQLNCLENSDCDPNVAENCLYGSGGGSSSGGASNSGGASSGGGSSTGAALGEACDCPEEGDWVTCSGSGECEPSLTCVEYGGGKRCSKPCEAGDACGAGLSCTDLHVGSVKMGTYCWD